MPMMGLGACTRPVAAASGKRLLLGGRAFVRFAFLAASREGAPEFFAGGWGNSRLPGPPPGWQRGTLLPRSMFYLPNTCYWSESSTSAFGK